MSVISFITVSHIKDYISSTCHTLVLCLPVLQRCIKIYLLSWSFDTDADSCCWWWQFAQQQLHTFYTEWRIKCRGLQYLLCSIHITEPLVYATFYCILHNFVILNNNDRSHHIDHNWCQPLLYSTIFVSPCIVQYWSHLVISILESPSEVQYWCHPVLHNIGVTLYCTLSVPPCIQSGPLLWPPQLICSFIMRPSWNQRPGITINCYLWTFVLEDDYV